MSLDPQVTTIATGLGLILGKLAEVLWKRRRSGSDVRQQRQLDRLEAKVDLLNEAALETQHRLARSEERLEQLQANWDDLRGMGRLQYRNGSDG